MLPGEEGCQNVSLDKERSNATERTSCFPDPMQSEAEVSRTGSSATSSSYGPIETQQQATTLTN